MTFIYSTRAGSSGRSNSTRVDGVGASNTRASFALAAPIELRVPRVAASLRRSPLPLLLLGTPEPTSKLRSGGLFLKHIIPANRLWGFLAHKHSVQSLNRFVVILNRNTRFQWKNRGKWADLADFWHFQWGNSQDFQTRPGVHSEQSKQHTAEGTRAIRQYFGVLSMENSEKWAAHRGARPYFRLQAASRRQPAPNPSF